jgi:tricorn protease
MSSSRGYHRFPTLHADRIVFVAEDALWTVSIDGGRAERVTANRGVATHPVFSPDGEWVAFTSRLNGPAEAFCLPAGGGPARRLTYLGMHSTTVAWSFDGGSVVLASDAWQPFEHVYGLLQVPRDGGLPAPLPVGPSSSIAYGPGGCAVLCRNGFEPAFWKRYRGGMAGDLWIDAEGQGQFRRLVQLSGNLASPLWLGGRIYFVSDHEGIGNLYSCLPTGDDVRRHTDHDRFFVRNPRTDGRQIVYHAGGDLFVYAPSTETAKQLEVDLRSPGSRSPHLADVHEGWEEFALHPSGEAVALTVRGRAFVMANWAGPVVPVGELQGVRYRHIHWLHDGNRLVCVSDSGGEEALEVHDPAVAGPAVRLEELDLGIIVDLKASPTRPQVVLANQRFELWLVDLESRAARLLDRSDYEVVQGLDFSPDGRWIAYSLFVQSHSALVKICDLATGTCTAVTRPVLYDIQPCFARTGDLLYFLSYREFNPAYDNVRFDLGFLRGVRPCVVTLREGVASPFAAGNQRQLGARDRTRSDDPTAVGALSEPEDGLRVELENIADRVTALPLADGRYQQVSGDDRRLLYTSTSSDGERARHPWELQAKSYAALQLFDFHTQRVETLAQHVSSFQVSADGTTVAYRSGSRLRIFPLGCRPEERTVADRRSGWLALNRVRVVVDPSAERRQMYREAWRLQRDCFWDARMPSAKWDRVYDRYRELVDRVSTRAEFSDVLWEMQGELGSSHALEVVPTVSPSPPGQGYLGAEFRYEASTNAYRITHVVRGDPSRLGEDSPLNQPGVRVEPGQYLLAVAGRSLGADCTPHEALAHHAQSEMVLTVADAEGPRMVVVKTLDCETPARYREWVASQRAWVHAHSQGKVGYVHIPDMLARGFAEFHRALLAELDREALVIDVRHNRGGHISGLVLETLARRRVGFAVGRWGRARPYPPDSPAGPRFVLANERTGSDGEVFVQGFRSLGMGLVIGKRTCGAAIGTRPLRPLVDGTITTQPEFAFWFADVGWGLENRGVAADIEVENSPQDFRQGRDRQLEVAVAQILRHLDEHPPLKPPLASGGATDK